MKRIESPEEIKKRQKRNKFIVGFVMIFLLLFSTAGYAFYSGDGLTNNQDSGFEQGQYVNGLWAYQMNGEVFYFLKDLETAKEIQVSLTSGINNYYGKPLFIVSDDSIVESEISRNIGRYASRIQKACYEKCELDLPEKTCDDNLVIYKESENNKVYQDKNCIFIEGDLTSVDAFLYKIFGFY